MKLQKKIYKTTEMHNSMDRSFKEAKRTKDDDISVEKFFQLYDKLFYSIQKTGRQSHASLVKKSSEYAGGVLKSKNAKKQNT